MRRDANHRALGLFSLMLMAGICLGVCGRAFGGAPALPEGAVSEDTVGIAYVNYAQITPDVLRATVKALLGAQAPLMDSAMDDWQKKYSGPSQAGVDYVMLVVSSTTPDQDPIFYVHLKPGADAAAAIKALKEDFGREDSDDAKFTRQGDFLVVSPKNAPAPAAGSPARAKEFSDALASIFQGGDKPLAAVMIPNADARKKMNDSMQGAPPALGDLVPALLDAKWMGVSVALGDAPSLAVAALTADAAAATALLEKVKAGLDQGKQMAEGMRARGPQAAQQAAVIDEAISAINPKVDGPRFEITVDAKGLTPLVTAIVLPAVKRARDVAERVKASTREAAAPEMPR